MAIVYYGPGDGASFGALAISYAPGEGGEVPAGTGSGSIYTYIGNKNPFDIANLFRVKDADGVIRDVKMGYDVSLTYAQWNALEQWYDLEEGTGTKHAPEAPSWSNIYFDL